jgi:protein involved in polysaccharide export with SLBB domain
MKPGEAWSSWWRRWGLGIGLVLLAGCAAGRSHVDRALMADHGKAVRNQGVADLYTVACPDVLEVTVAGRPELSGRCAIGPDGRIGCGAAGSIRVEDQTPREVAQRVARQVRVPPEQISVRVAEFKSRQIYLAGQGIGLQRAVPYQGQETVLDLLQRAGGVTPSVAPEDVYVVRSHIADGERPEVFHVDLQAIVLKKDQRTNLRLQPFDQVYVGETWQGKLNKCLPPVLRPLCEACWGIGPHKGTS